MDFWIHHLLTYCLHFLTLVFCLQATNENETEILEEVESSDLVRFGALPPSFRRPTDPLLDLRQQYKLEDFLWTGSGDGPMNSDQDGGLAWEDNGNVRGDGYVILVTKTMVLFKTVMTTVYPVELTPTVVISTPRVTITPSLPDESLFLSLTSSFSSTPGDIEPSPTYFFPTEPTATPTPFFDDDDQKNTTTTEVEDIPTPAPETSVSTNPIYWVTTVIRANASAKSTANFQENMQENLAKVYASAFKRHLLNALGIPNNTSEKRLSRRRRETNEQEVDYEWLFVSVGNLNARLRTSATTAMNVSVSILNITTDDRLPSLSMFYVVCAEGKPVPAASAVKDMNLVSDAEMESQISYAVIKKAEALVSPLSTTAHIQEARTSPWLVVAVTSMFLIVFLILLLLILMWKWKKRPNDRRIEIQQPSRPQSSGIEGGVINPAFLGPPSPADRFQIHKEREERKQERRRKLSQEKQATQGHDSTLQQTTQQATLAKDLDEILSSEGKKMQSKMNREGSADSYETSEESSGSKNEENSPTSATVFVKSAAQEPTGGNIKLETMKSKESGKGRKRSPVKRLSPYKRAQTAVGRRKKPKPEDSRREEVPVHEQRPLSASSREKVTFGHLDICDDSVAKPISDDARKLMQSRAQSSKRRNGGMETTISSSSTSTKTERKEIKRIREFDLRPEEPIIMQRQDMGEDEEDSLTPDEQDREIEESIESGHSRRVDFTPNPRMVMSPKKDAQVQSPKKLRSVLKGKPKAKPRRFQTATKMSAESLISTESEEILELHEFDDSSTESNPLGKMRKRFHQFLDDAFNVIGKKEDEESRSKSAKVSLKHHIETREQSRPWTSSHIIHEESFESPRPKSASLGPPKRAWTASTERRCHSATSESSGRSRAGRSDPTNHGTTVVEERDSDNEPDQNSSPLSTMETSASQRNPSFVSSTAPIFPRYPIYPDIPYPTHTPLDSSNLPGRSQTQGQEVDPAVPLIAAIKEEIKRFERVRVTEQDHEFHTRWST